MAVVWFGRHVEGKLSERDKKGRPLYSLEQLLGDDVTAGNGFDAFASMLGAFG